MTREKALEYKAQGKRLQLLRMAKATVWAVGNPPTSEQLMPACQQFAKAVQR